MRAHLLTLTEKQTQQVCIIANTTKFKILVQVEIKGVLSHIQNLQVSIQNTSTASEET